MAMRATNWDDDGGMRMQLAPLTPMVKRLIFATVGVFILQLVVLLAAGTPAVQVASEWLGLDVSRWKSIFLPVWQLITYGFLHDPFSLSHILWNMLWLYFMGGMLEGIIGARRLLTFYLVSIAVAGVVQVLGSFAMGEAPVVVGASGATLAVTIVMATLRPQTRIIFLFIPLTLRTVAIIKVVGDLYGLIISVGTEAGGGVAYFAHLGGAAFGFLAARQGWIWRDPAEDIERKLEERRVAAVERDDQRIDELLEKIHREGIQSLSRSEKAALKRASKRK